MKIEDENIFIRSLSTPIITFKILCGALHGAVHNVMILNTRYIFHLCLSFTNTFLANNIENIREKRYRKICTGTDNYNLLRERKERDKDNIPISFAAI